MRHPKVFLGTVAGLLGLALVAWSLGVGGAWGQQQGGHGAQQGRAQQSAGSAKDKDEEEEGPPPGWKFTLPKDGDPARGRAVFVKLECFSCHEVKGETFPPPSPGGTVGPELSGMAASHPPEFFAESIITPSAAIDKGRGYEAPDGSSKMPSFNEDLSVKELVDLVSYLMSLKPPAVPDRTPVRLPSRAPANHGH